MPLFAFTLQLQTAIYTTNAFVTTGYIPFYSLWKGVSIRARCRYPVDDENDNGNKPLAIVVASLAHFREVPVTKKEDIFRLGIVQKRKIFSTTRVVGRYLRMLAKSENFERAS